MGQLCCQPEDPNAPTDKPQAECNAPLGPVRRKVHGAAALGNATPTSGESLAATSPQPDAIAAVLAGAVAAGAAVCAAGTDPTPTAPTPSVTSPLAASATPTMGASPAEGDSEGLRPALADVTNYRSGQRRTDKCPEQDGRRQVELSLPAERILPAPAVDSQCGDMEEEDDPPCIGSACRDCNGAKHLDGRSFVADADGQPHGAAQGAPRPTRLDMRLISEDDHIELGHYAPARPRAARSPVGRDELPPAAEQPSAADRAMRAGRLDTGLLPPDAQLGDDFISSMINAPLQRPAAAVIDFRPAAGYRASASQQAQPLRCATPRHTPSASAQSAASSPGSSSSSSTSSPSHSLSAQIRPARPALDHGPEGHLRVSEGALLAAGNRERVRIVSFLGSGAFSAVWRAAKRGRGSDFALKICRAGAQNRAAARKEARVLVHVHQHNPLRRYASRVLSMLSNFEVASAHGTHVCIGMPLMGSDVAQLLAAHGGRGVAPALAKALMKQALQGVAYLAAVNYAHSDLKPANLLLGPSCRPGAPASRGAASGDDLLRGAYARSPGEGDAEAILRQYSLKIGDMGGCLDVQRAQPHSELELTTAYRAPEVVTGTMRVSTAVGVWACGCIAYEMITGELMFSPGQQRSEFATDQAQWCAWYQTLGPPPPMYGASGQLELAHLFFDRRGTLLFRPRAHGTPIGQRLATCRGRRRIRGEADLLISFLHNLLEYDPEERATAQGALTHPWLQL